MGETETFGSFIPLGMQYPGTDVLRIKQRKNRLCMVLAQGVFKILGRKKIKNHVSDISPICPVAPTGYCLHFWHARCRRLITHAKFCVDLSKVYVFRDVFS